MNLPAQWTSFVGRERELAEVPLLLERGRLITLTGAGGVGKTRLAIAVAEGLAHRFGDGVVFVDLAPVIHPEAVPAAIARALGLRDDGELPLVERLATALQDRELLLILDNFERVVNAAAVVLELLGAAPQTKALVTSRAPLRVRGEREFVVTPLACPALANNDTLDELSRYPALTLFVQRAQDVRPDFALAQETAASVAEICRRLDGLPLALELAAARIRVLSPEAVLARLGQSLALLTGGPRDVPARQQTLRATIEWSYELLNRDEQTVFRALAVFAGGFSLDAARDVAGASLDVLSSLVEKNLLRQPQGPNGEPRFGMLETVREFGLEQLESHGEAEATRRAHAAYFATFAVEASAHMRRSGRERWLRRIDAEMDNLRAVVEWSAAGADGGEALMRVLGGVSFFYYWRICGHLNEGWSWCELALAAPAARAPSTDRMRLLWTAGALGGYMEKFPVARPWLEESVRLARAAGDRATLGIALVFLGWAEVHLGVSSAIDHIHEAIAVLRDVGDTADLVLALNVAAVPFVLVGDLSTAHKLVDEALVLARDLDDDWATAVALSNAGYLDVRERDWASAALHLQQSLDLNRRVGDDGSVAFLLNNLAVVARHQDDDDTAAALFEQSLAQQRRLGLPAAMTLINLADLWLRRQHTAAARAHVTEALRVCARTGEQRAIVGSLGVVVRLATAIGQHESAARLFGAAMTLRDKARVTLSLEQQTAVEDSAGLARSGLGEEVFRTMAAGGAAAAIEQILGEALAWLETWPVTRASATSGGLSGREMEVLRLLARGMSNQQIATALVISMNTVARHVSNIFDKVGAANRTEAAAYAHRHGL